MILSVIGAVCCTLGAISNGIAKPRRWYHTPAAVLMVVFALINIANIIGA